MAYTKRGAAVFASTDANGAVRTIVPAEAATWATEVEVLAAASGATVVEDTVANLPSSANGTIALVVDNGASNGIYVRESGSWVKKGPLPGITGATGAAGTAGAAGAAGADGAAATVAVGTVTTGAAGTAATVSNSGTSAAAVLNFGIPRGEGAFRSHDRPGDALTLFSEAFTGPAEIRPIITTGSIVSNADGAALRVAGSTAQPGVIAARQDFAVEPGQVYGVRYAVRRMVEATDPWGNGIEFCVAWLDATKQLISLQVLELFDLRVAFGRKVSDWTISRDQSADITAPSTARYMTPLVRIWGYTGTTDVEVIRRWETAGLPGAQGNQGYSGELAVEQDGADRSVVKLVDWLGGSGPQPPGAGQYIGAGGLVATAAEAVSIKGNVGPQGARGVSWRGAWSSATAYSIGDLVTDVDGDDATVVWIARTENTNQKPRDNAEDWSLFPASFSDLLDDGLITDAVADTFDDGGIV